MKKIFSLIVILIVCQYPSKGQNRILSQKKEITKELKDDLQQKLRSFNVYQLNNYMPPDPKELLNLEILFGDFNWNLVLSRNNLQGENGKAFFTKDGKLFQDTIEVTSYKGQLVNNSNIKARINIWDEYISGYIRDGFEYYYIEPLKDFLKDKTQSGIIVFKESDIIKHNQEENESYIEGKANLELLISESTTTSTYTLELALEADSFFKEALSYSFNN